MASHPQVPWVDIRGFRNAVIHGYFKIDWDIVWNAATKNAPQLRSTVIEMLEAKFPGFQPENT